jgi:hypothetical protein
MRASRRRQQVSDQERDKLAKTADEEGSDDVEAHKLAAKLPHVDEDGDDVEAHKLGNKLSSG